MKYFSLIIINILLPFSICYAGTDNINVTAEVDKAFITIGDKVTYTVSISHDPEIKIITPVEPVSWGDFELNKKKELDEFINEEGNAVNSFKFLISIFKLGEYIIEGPLVKYRAPGGEEKEIYANDLYITVESITGEEDVKEDIKEIKDVEALKANYLYFLLLTILLLVVFTLTLVLVKKNVLDKKNQNKQGLSKYLLPHEEALSELDALPHAKVVYDGRMEKNYYSRISEIVKKYISRSFNLDTLDQTTFEMVNLIKKTNISDQIRQDIQSILTMCDMVKFAKYRPQVSDILNHFRLTKEIIENSRADNEEDKNE